jgi:dipeptidyl aminopeptidase/acylaminoacyl peptidase
MSRRFRFTALALVIFVWLPASAGGQSMARDGYVLPPESVQDLFRRDKNMAKLDRLSPDGNHFVVPQFEELTDLALMSQRTLRLAMLEIVPDVNREWRQATYGNRGINLYSLADRRVYPVRIPAGFVSDLRWSPDGRQLAFILHLPTVSNVWVADVATGNARAVSEAPVMATLMARPGGGGEAPETAGGRMLQWLPDGSLLTALVPANRGAEPAEPSVPTAPIIRRSREKETPTSTQPFLLRTAHDERLFKYYTTAQLATVAPGRAPRTIGEPAMYLDYWLSPDGTAILRETLEEPFSYLVGHTSFGRRLEVIDLNGRVMSEIRRLPLQEAQTRGGNPEAENLPRDVAWRPDGKGLSLLWRERGNGDDNQAAATTTRHDRLMLLAPPFDLARAQTLVSTEHRISNVRYARDGRYAFATLAKRGAGGNSARRDDLVAYDLSGAQPATFVLKANIDPEDPLTLPGEVMTAATGNGIPFALVSGDSTAAFLKGDGYKTTFKPQPFIDRVVIRTAATTRLFEGATDTYDEPLVALDADLTRLIVSRESSTRHPDSYLWTRSGGQMENLTNNKDPYPEITGARRVDFSFARRDGVTVQARISLPVGYQPGTRVPAVFWTYPREFEDEKAYGRGTMRARNHNAHTPLSFLRWSDIWLTQGYALVYPDVPILGKDGKANDNFRAHLVDTMYAAIRKVDELGYVDVNRIGHGGHSYGAFTTGNLLAHTPFFKAGIAGDGAYNRTLTPMTFQSERRSFWEAPETYTDMSPFFYADHINTPLLMYHGAQDNNSGTFLIQSERMMQALTGLGKTAVLYIYPYESHAPRAKENFLDLWARWLEWFDKYVKNAEPAARTTTAPLQ